MATVTKTDLTDKLAERTGMSKSEAKGALNALLDTLTDSLKQGDKVQLTGFGTFEVRDRKARTGVKPGTSEKIEIPASKAPAFKAGKALKNAVN